MNQKILAPRSKWKVEVLDRDTGVVKRVITGENLVTDEGLAYLMAVGFVAGDMISTWRVALFESNHTPVATNTYVSPGYTEFTSYSGSRPAANFVQTAASLTNSADRAVFTAEATKTIYGGALVGGPNSATPGNKSVGNVLYCSVKFSEAYPVESGDPIRVTVTLSGTSGY